MSNFVPIVALNCQSLYVRICANDFMQTVQHDGAQQIDENCLKEISQKFFFWDNSSLAQSCPKLCKAIWPKIVQGKLCVSVLKKIISTKVSSKSSFGPNEQFWLHGVSN